MGMTDLFDASKADLTRISRGGDLYVTDAVHKAVIDVNEEGTTASAVTGQSKPGVVLRFSFKSALRQGS